MDLPGAKAGRRRSVLTRRDFLKAGAAFGAAGAVGRAAQGSGRRRLLDAALASASGAFDPAAVKHVVVLMQENRSFDHYFGTLAGTHGFADPYAGRYPGSSPTPFQQRGPRSALPGWTGPTVGSEAVLEPWRLVSDPPFVNGQATNDITHDWTPQHQAWNGGRMDQWFAAHAATDKNNSVTSGVHSATAGHLGSATSNDGYMTMGYLTAADVGFYHALADAFTICDGYFCSVMGPTDPNRLMWMSNSVGIGKPNGPLLTTLVQTRPQEYGKFGWKTMPEALRDAGVSWKMYGDPTGQVLFNPLPYFKQYQTDDALAARAFTPQYPEGFVADVAAGTLPQVSWIMPPAVNCEHPAATPGAGEYLVAQILQTLVSNPGVWAQTVLFVIYDENGGWFDHVPPPTAPDTARNRDEGEYVTGMAGAGYVDGPVGLGFRTPCLIVSPFSRGGYLCSPYYTDGGGNVRYDPAATFDSTSVNRFIAAVFGAQGHSVELPNLSSWRRSVTGDFTAAFAGVHDASIPSLPATSMLDPSVDEQAVIDGLLGTVAYAPQPYPPPTSNGTFPPPLDGANLTSLRPATSTAPAVPAGREAPAPGAQVQGAHLTQANPSSLAATGLSSWLEKAGLTA
ncbi:MAG: twin-arginine translocation signal domain-containing protein, partial [Acidimicrobiia bacterium]|nr:twin-arginine translocation signal domain-containing protein [Acidimicrobiia bacterium]